MYINTRLTQYFASRLSKQILAFVIELYMIGIQRRARLQASASSHPSMKNVLCRLIMDGCGCCVYAYIQPLPPTPSHRCKVRFILDFFIIIFISACANTIGTYERMNGQEFECVCGSFVKMQNA